MKHYRNQPQATSHVYRSVLLRKTGAPGAGDKTSSEKVSKQPRNSVFWALQRLLPKNCQMKQQLNKHFQFDRTIKVKQHLQLQQS